MYTAAGDTGFDVQSIRRGAYGLEMVRLTAPLSTPLVRIVRRTGDGEGSDQSNSVTIVEAGVCGCGMRVEGNMEDPFFS